MSKVISVEEFPSLHHEVERKAITALHNAARKYERKLINEREFMAALDAIFDCYSGLASQETMDLLHALQKQIKATKKTEHRVFFNVVSNEIVIVTKDDVKLSVSTFPGTKAIVKTKSFRDSDDPLLEVARASNVFSEGLLARAYDEF